MKLWLDKCAGHVRKRQLCCEGEQIQNMAIASSAYRNCMEDILILLTNISLPTLHQVLEEARNVLQSLPTFHLRLPPTPP
jgi:hypothetical protein